MIQYAQYRSLPAEYVRAKVKEFLAEDIPACDVTSLATVPASAVAAAEITAQAPVVFAGASALREIFSAFGEIEFIAEDGARLENGGLIARFRGSARVLLARERVALNLIQRLSGIATHTSKYVEIAKPYGVRILDTRKTVPGLRLFDKYAVTVGGGYNHRLDLSSGFLIKDNHIKAAGGIRQAIENARQLKIEIAGRGDAADAMAYESPLVMSGDITPGAFEAAIVANRSITTLLDDACLENADFSAIGELPVQVEVDNFEQLREALDCGVDGILIDNFTPEDTRRVVEIVRARKGGENIFLETSGGVTLETVALYVPTGIDAISVGALTHSVKAAEIHMEFL
ncbi:MAG: carboxylating nicotinate-nucleotide diphosphorylase [Chloroflexota bacterium]